MANASLRLLDSNLLLFKAPFYHSIFAKRRNGPSRIHLIPKASSSPSSPSDNARRQLISVTAAAAVVGFSIASIQLLDSPALSEEPPAVSDPNHGFILETGRTIVETKNGGNAWVPPSITLAEDDDFNYRFNSVSFKGKERYVGNPATLLYMHDADKNGENTTSSAEQAGDMGFTTKTQTGSRLNLATCSDWPTSMNDLASHIPQSLSVAASGYMPYLLIADIDPATAKTAIGIMGPFLSGFGFLFIVRIVMSWYPKLPVGKFPYVVAYAPTEPILRATRKLIPPLGGVDVTPVVWFALISFLNEILVGSQGLLVLLSQQIQSG